MMVLMVVRRIGGGPCGTMMASVTALTHGPGLPEEHQGQHQSQARRYLGPWPGTKALQLGGDNASGGHRHHGDDAKAEHDKGA